MDKIIIMCSVLLVIISDSYGQAFIPMDNDTGEFIESVNYSLYKGNKVIYSAITLTDKITSVKQAIVFDSISFSRVDYEAKGFLKHDLDSVVYLSKKTIYLDEIVIGSKDDNEIILGETNRFVKRSSHTLSKDLDYGLVVVNGFPYKLQLNKLMFYVDKVKLKTAYRVNFSEVNEIPVQEGFQVAKIGELVYATDALYLNPKDKNRVEIILPPDWCLLSTKKIFVWIQLLGYYDEFGNEVDPGVDKRTRLKFQLSNKTNYYSRMFEAETQKMSRDIVNLNLMFNHEYAFRFFTTPHKSSIVAPAIVLYAKKVDL